MSILNKLLVAFMAASISVAMGAPAFAWSEPGHRIVAGIAERHITPKTMEAVEKLLALEGDTSMQDVSVWADEVRKLKVPPQPMHSVRIPLQSDTYDEKRDCGNKMCAIAAIRGSISALKSQTVPDTAKLIALKYLIHIVGDIHQPLHASFDTGKYQCFLHGKKTTLHKVWDRFIVSDHGKAGELITQIDENVPSPSRYGSSVSWALESHKIAKQDIFPYFDGLPFKGDAVVLPDNYTEIYWPVVETRLKDAGVRLAWVLNAIFDPDWVNPAG